MKYSEDKIDTVGLDKLIKSLKKMPQVQVGIFGGVHEGGGGTNAEVGAVHEFGTSKLPQRSFLRVPLIDHYYKDLKASGIFSKKGVEQIIKEGSFLGAAMKMGVLAEGIILTGFDTGGYGKWKPSDMRYKKVHQTLVETQQLRNSITHRVNE